MSFPQTKNPAQNSILANQFLRMAGEFDPRVVGVKALAGTEFIYRRVLPLTPILLMKQDDTVDTNWAVIGGSSAPSVFGTFAAPITTNGAATIATGGSFAVLNTLFLKSTGGPVVCAGNPILPTPTVDGQRLTIFGTSNVDTVELPSINGLDLNGGVSCILDANQALSLEGMIATGWREVGRRS